jgi:hypothetical protein
MESGRSRTLGNANPQIDVVFARQPMPGVPSFDLARRTLDAPLRQVRGQER